MACGKGARSPMAVATSICRTSWKRTKQCLVLMFDNPSRMHAMRDVLHQKRYKPLSQAKLDAGAASGKTVVGGKIHIKMRHLVEPYDQIRPGTLDSSCHPIGIASVHRKSA